MKFTDSTIEQVWEHGRVVAGYDPTQWRQDECGAWIQRDDYENERSEFGWWIVAVCTGQPDTVSDLRPFHCRNGYDRANDRAHCMVSAMPQGCANRFPE